MQEINGEEATAERLPTCATCREAKERLDDIPIRPRERRPRLTDIAEFRTYELDSSTETHLGREDGVLASYLLTQNVRCSFPDHTAHRDGRIIETLCSLRVNIGHVCASKWIVDYDRVLERQARAEALGERVSELRNAPRETLLRLEEKAGRARQQAKFVSRIETLLPRLFDEMTSRANARGGPRANVEIQVHRSDGPGMKPKLVVEVEILRGLSLWSNDPLEVALEAIKQEAIALQREVESVHEGHEDEHHAAALHARLDDILSREKSIGAALAERSGFFSHVNLQRAKVAANLKGLQVIGSKVKVISAGKELLLGEDGFSPVMS